MDERNIMSQVRNRKKLRREYLKRKQLVLIRLSVAGVTLVAIGVLAGFLVAPFFTVSRIPDPDNVEMQKALVESLPIFAICGIPAYFCWKKMKQIEAEVANVPFVPADAASTLPADEILVRGAQPPPVVQGEVLLRAAQGVESPKEELLRIAQNQ